jgi:tRNA/tmRNA/rRNA uracil-C5-methylase (TrmA/RlmC/RlmD family)
VTRRARAGRRGPPAPWPLVGTELELVVGPVASGGSCVARVAGEGSRVVFVRHALPGERVRAVVTEDAQRSYLRADAVEVLVASPDRVEPPCPHAGPGRCGGCDWQHAALPAQRALKAAVVREQLSRLAGLEVPVVVEELPTPAGAASGLGWRTRVGFAVAPGGAVGFHRHRSAAVHPVETCPIAAAAVNDLAVPAHRWPGTAAVEVEVGTAGRVTVVTPRRSGRAQPALPDGLPPTGVAVRDPHTREVTATALPHGVAQEVGGRRYEVSAGGFWQVHPAAAEVLLAAVLDGLRPRPGERALDLYAGAGLFAAALAERVGPTGRVHAVEADRRAGADAARNTAGCPQVAVHTASVTPGLLDAPWAGRPDVVVLDPPRTGAGLAVTERLAGCGARALAYVACDPASLARDLAVLLAAGWRLTSLRAFDLFPMTAHVECVAVLEAPAPGRT